MLDIFHSIIERKSFWNSHSVSSFIWACEPKNKNYIPLKLLRLWKWNPFWHQYGMLNYCINLSAWQWHNKVHNIIHTNICPTIMWSLIVVRYYQKFMTSYWSACHSSHYIWYTNMSFMCLQWQLKIRAVLAWLTIQKSLLQSNIISTMLEFLNIRC